MTDGEKKQVKKMIVFSLIGYIVGVVVKKIECLIWLTSTNPIIDVIKGFTVPFCTVIAIVIFLYLYQKDKEE